MGVWWGSGGGLVGVWWGALGRRAIIARRRERAERGSLSRTQRRLVASRRSLIEAGQLACDLGIAQFILQNASNVARPHGGINNIRAMGTITGISVKNGYLQVPGAPPPDVSAFHARLPEMEVLGMRDVKACGLVESFPLQATTPLATSSHTVDLIYASAAPIGSDYNNPDTPAMRSIADGVLLGQYTAALRLAIQRGNCDVYLMPLGGGVFDNDSKAIKSAIVCAIEALKPRLTEAGVRVGILTFHRNDEHTIYRSQHGRAR